MYSVYRLTRSNTEPATRFPTLAAARAYAAAQKRGGDIFHTGGWLEAWRAGALVGFMEGDRWRTADAEIDGRLARAVAA